MQQQMVQKILSVQNYKGILYLIITKITWGYKGKQAF